MRRARAGDARPRRASTASVAQRRLTTQLCRGAAAFAVVLLAGCAPSSPLCGNRLLDRTFSADRHRVAYVFVRDCGATTGFSTNIAIGRSADDPAKVSIVFTADDDHGAAETRGSAIWLSVAWTGPDTLSIVYAEHARLFRHVTGLDGVRVVYRAGSPYSPPAVP